MSKKSNKPQTKRDKDKYRFLFKEKNARAIKEYLETEEYMNGVYNEEGDEISRPLNDEEKDFMNRFNANFYCGHFEKDGTDFVEDRHERRRLWNEKYARRMDALNSAGATYRLHEYDDARYARYLDKGCGYEDEEEDE